MKTRFTRSNSKALGIPCPWSGDEFEPVPWTYKYWFKFYVRTRQLRHKFNLHDAGPGIATRCTWCGKVIK